MRVVFYLENGHLWDTIYISESPSVVDRMKELRLGDKISFDGSEYCLVKDRLVHIDTGGNEITAYEYVMEKC